MNQSIFLGPQNESIKKASNEQISIRTKSLSSLELYSQNSNIKISLKRTYFILLKLLGENNYICTSQNWQQ